MSIIGGLNNDYIVSVDHFDPHGALKPQKTVFLNADLTLDSLRRRFVKIFSKETPYGRPHAMVRGRICPPVKNGNVEGSKNR